MPEVRGRNWDSSSAFAGAVNGRWPCEVLQPPSACRFSEGRGTCGSVGCAGGLVRREVAIGFELLLPGLGFSKCSCSGRFSSVLSLLNFLCLLIMRVPADEVVRL